jgi:hypothetical protein
MAEKASENASGNSIFNLLLRALVLFNFLSDVLRFLFFADVIIAKQKLVPIL